MLRRLRWADGIGAGIEYGEGTECLRLAWYGAEYKDRM